MNEHHIYLDQFHFFRILRGSFPGHLKTTIFAFGNSAIHAVNVDSCQKVSPEPNKLNVCHIEVPPSLLA